MWNAAVAAGLVHDGGEGQLTDDLVGQVVAEVRPARPQGHGTGWEALECQHGQIVEWVGKDLTVVKIGDLLARRGVLVALENIFVKTCRPKVHPRSSRVGRRPRRQAR
jgi:hypothetical protein